MTEEQLIDAIRKEWFKAWFLWCQIYWLKPIKGQDAVRLDAQGREVYHSLCQVKINLPQEFVRTLWQMHGERR